jgi:hypothetical protein
MFVSSIAVHNPAFTMSGLHRFGFVGSAAKVRKVSRSGQDSLEPAPEDVDGIVPALNASQLSDKSREFPWALYCRPSNRSSDEKPPYIWRCSICEAAVKQLLNVSGKMRTMSSNIPSPNSIRMPAKQKQKPRPCRPPVNRMQLPSHSVAATTQERYS